MLRLLPEFFRSDQLLSHSAQLTIFLSFFSLFLFICCCCCCFCFCLVGWCFGYMLTCHHVYVSPCLYVTYLCHRIYVSHVYVSPCLCVTCQCITCLCVTVCMRHRIYVSHVCVSLCLCVTCLCVTVSLCHISMCHRVNVSLTQTLTLAPTNPTLKYMLRVRERERERQRLRPVKFKSYSSVYTHIDTLEHSHGDT